MALPAMQMCFYGDVDGAMARALGVETDLRAAGLGPGMRSNRFSLFVNDGSIVKKVLSPSFRLK